MTSSLKEDTTYLLVSFTGASSKKKESVNLIPRSWASCNDGIWTCLYPDPVDYPKMDGWLKELKDPEPEWGTYDVTILKEARDHEQAIRRRQRSYKDINVVSTDDTDVDVPDTMPATFSKAARKMFLNEPTIDDITEPQKTVAETISTPKSSRQRLPAAAETDNITSGPQGAAEISGIVDAIEGSDIAENISTLPNPNVESPQLEASTLEDIPDKWKCYLDSKLGELEAKITLAVRSSKRSILYDIEKKIEEVKNTIIVSTGGNARSTNASSARDKLGFALPIKELDDYLLFEASIASDDKKKQSLKSLLAVLIARSNSWKDDVGKILNGIMSKAVQINFSGCGRKVKGRGKRNFSTTIVFSCMKDVLEEHYKHITEPLQLISRVSRWLAGAGDREGGRLVRPSNP